MKNKNILFLGKKNRLIDFLKGAGQSVYLIESKLTLKDLREIAPTNIISYGYRYILTPDIVKEYPRIINLHISMLPHNRGAYPNFWSWFMDTPKGVTIHYIDEGIDTGDILLQREVKDCYGVFDTLKTTYDKLKKTIENLFIENWEDLLNHRIKPRKQKGAGSYYSVKDYERQLKYLEKCDLWKGWDTKVLDMDKLCDFVAETEMSENFWTQVDEEIKSGGKR